MSDTTRLSADELSDIRSIIDRCSKPQNPMDIIGKFPVVVEVARRLLANSVAASGGISESKPKMSDPKITSVVTPRKFIEAGERLMESNELKEARERLRAIPSVSIDALADDPPDGINSALWTIARAYLAEHPADDDEPATDAWACEMLGGLPVTGEPYDMVILFDPRVNELIQVRVALVDGRLELNGYVVEDNPARGDVRQLIKALKGGE